jgi:hypothetical protein
MVRIWCGFYQSNFNMTDKTSEETPEEIVEHLAELGLHPEDDGLDDVLENAPTTPKNPHGE